jgi:hypothetical protein
MRVISQSGTLDLPYENFVIGKTASNEIVAMKTVGDYPENVMASVIAKYSTEEKAIKAMEMLRETYDKGEYVRYPKISKVKSDKDDDLTIWNIQTLEKFFPKGYYEPCKVFQFPADDEIEV